MESQTQRYFADLTKNVRTSVAFIRTTHFTCDAICIFKCSVSYTLDIVKEKALSKWKAVKAWHQEMGMSISSDLSLIFNIYISLFANNMTVPIILIIELLSPTTAYNYYHIHQYYPNHHYHYHPHPSQW
jgi:hypothetical protein